MRDQPTWNDIGRTRFGIEAHNEQFRCCPDRRIDDHYCRTFP